MSESKPKVQIGSPSWVKDLQQISRPLGAGFWAGFQRVSKARLRQLEKELGHRLPDEFQEFYRTVG